MSRGDDPITLVGYSSPAILIGFIFSLCLIVLPLLLGLRRLQGPTIISRSNSLIMSAACHVSTLRHIHSPSNRRKTVSLNDNNAEVAGNADDWVHSATSAISAVMDEQIELRPLIPVDRRTAATLGGSTTPSEQAQSGAPAKNTRIADTQVSAHNSPVIDEQTTQPILPSLSAHRPNSSSADRDSDTLAASMSSQDADDHSFILWRPISGSVTAEDASQHSSADSDGSTACAGQAGAAESDADPEERRLITSASADGDHSRRTTAPCSVAGDAEDSRLQAARSLEDGPVSEEDDVQFRIRLSRSRIRWGAVRMPEEFYMQFPDLEDGAKLGHLTFGTEEQRVAPPNPGYFYA